ncbi:hypothetical protein M7I_8245 [Glarea lozoyensis 74030]|nr:hypothetical protein M7I_8245 [Glarea lozoyensis 74030]
MAPIKQPDGGFVISRPVPADQMYPFVVAHRDTGAFVKALVDAPPGLNLMGASQFMTWPEWTKTWGDVLGVKAEFKTVPAEEFVEGVPKPLAQELSDTYLYLEEFGFDGGDSSVVAPEQLTFTVPLTTNKEYIESENWSSVLES